MEAHKLELNTRLQSEGQVASALFHQNTEAIHTQIRDLLNAALDIYAMGKLTPELALGKLGELYALRSFLDTLDSKSTRGQAASKEINNG